MVLERTYNVPLRREYLKVAQHKRTPKAQKALLAFLQKHMKTEFVKIGQHLNEELWKHGIKNPPHHVKVVVIKEDDGVAYAELEGFKYEKKTTKAETKKDKGKLQEMMEKLGGKEEKKEEKKSIDIESAAQTTTNSEKTENLKKEKIKKANKAEKQAESLEESKELAEKKKMHKAGKSSEPQKKKEEEQ